MSKVKLLLYCTKAKPYLNDYRHFEFCNKFVIMNKNVNALNGTIVVECDCEVSKIELHQSFYNYGPTYFTKMKEPFRYFSYNDLLKASCLQDNKMLKYLGNKGGYAIHIKNLHIFDKPKELNEYYKDDFLQELNDTDARVYKAPQNMCRVYDRFGNLHILISIKSEWLCKILNGEKTIEVRKQILKELKEQIENE